MDTPLKLVVVLLCSVMVAGWKSLPLRDVASTDAGKTEPVPHRVVAYRPATPLPVPCVETTYRVAKVENRSKGEVYERYIAIDFPAAIRDDLRMVEAAREVLPEYKREVMRADAKIRMVHIAVFEDAEFRYRGLEPVVTLKWAWIDSHEEHRVLTAYGFNGTYERKIREDNVRRQLERAGEVQRKQLEQLQRQQFHEQIQRQQQRQEPLRRRQHSNPWFTQRGAQGATDRSHAFLCYSPAVRASSSECSGRCSRRASSSACEWTSNAA